MVDDRPADAHGDLVGRDDGREDRLLGGPVLEGLADEPLGFRVDEHQEEAFGLGEKLHERIEDLGRDRVDLELGREVARLISRIALSLTSGLTMLAMALEREASSVWRWGASWFSPSVTIMMSPGSLEGPSAGKLRVKQELDVADIDPVARRQPMIDSRNDLGVVDLGQVPGVQIGQKVLLGLPIDLGMPAADAVGVEDDVAMLGRPADDDPIWLQLDDLPGRLAVGSFQECHAGRLPPAIGGAGPPLVSSATECNGCRR